MKKLFVCLLMAVCVFSGNLFATETTVFISQTYLRTTGNPNTFSDTFTAVDVTGFIIIRNGTMSGENRVTSATVTLNGVEVFTPDDFRLANYMIASQVELTDTNNIQVKLASNPDSFITIEVIHNSGYIPTFGPKQFLRTTGRPNQYTENFETTAIAGRLVIKNGDEDGSDRVTSAIIVLNGQQLFVPNDFKKSEYLYVAEIPIQETNQLEIALSSTPGVYLTIEIIPTIQPPFFSSSPVLTGAEDTLYIYDVDAIDPDNDDLAYSLSTASSGMNIDPVSGMIQWAPPQEQVGGHDVTVTVTDSDGLSVSQSFTVNIMPVNDPPEIEPIDEQVLNEAATLDVGISSSDVDNESLTLSVSSLPDFATLTDNGDGSGTISFFPGYEDAGSYSMTVSVSDGEFTDSDTFSLTVNNVNRAPSLIPIEDQTIDEDKTLQVPVSASDADGDPITITIFGLPAFAALTDNGGGSSSITFSPGYEGAGQYPMAITVSDGDLTDSDTFTLVVNNVNRPPVLMSIDNQSMDEAETIQLSVSANDLDGDTLSLNTSGLPAFATFTDNGNGTATISLSPGYEDSGNYSMTVSVSDGDLSNSDTFSLTINNVNRAPVLNSIEDQTIDEANTLQITISGNDPDGDNLTLTSSGLPAFAIFTDKEDGTGTIAFSPGNEDSGQYNLTVTASDGVLSDSKAFLLTVNNASSPPEITSLPVETGFVSTLYTYDVEAVDPDGDTLQYSLLMSPDGMTIDSASGLIEWLPDTEQIGNYKIVVEVIDNDGLSGTQTYLVSIVAVNHAPILNPIENYMMDEESTLDVDVLATDEDGDELVMTVTGLPSFGLFTDNGDGTGVISFHPGPDTIGRYAIGVVVSDRIESVSDFFILTVDQTGLLGTYYNHSINHPDMQGPSGGKNLVEATLTGSAPTLNVSGQSKYKQFDWWDEQYKVFQRLDSETDLQNGFGASNRWYPVTTGLPGDPNYFAVHWEGRFYVDADMTYTYNMGSDDDSWLFIDNRLVLDLGGVHKLSWISYDLYLSKGIHDIDIFFAERRSAGSAFMLKFFSDLYSIPEPPIAHFNFFQPLRKNQPLSASVVADGSSSSNPEDNSLTYLWYGPFESTGGVSPAISVPEGRYEISLIVDNGVSTSEVKTAELTISPCFYLSAVSRPGAVALAFDVVEGVERYKIYRSTASDPLLFELIGETLDPTYTDTNIENDRIYLYVVSADMNDGVCFSNIISRHTNGGGVVNHNPVIYSAPVLGGTAGIPYNYDVNATDPDDHSIRYSLTQNPDCMTIDPDDGFISWIPPEVGAYEVTVQANDHNGGVASQTFSIVVEGLKTTIPDVAGLSRARASDEIAYAFATIQSITEEYSETTPAGVVIRQSPGAGAILPLYAGVDLVVSVGNQVTTIPDVAGMTQSDAESAIIAAQLAVGNITLAYSPVVHRNHVISQYPNAGIFLPIDSEIDLVVSLGPEIVTVPDVSGMTLADAIIALNAETLSPGKITEVYINVPPAGIIFNQAPAAGTQVQHDTTVDLKVSLGPWTGPDNEPPDVSITSTSTNIIIGQQVTITVTATDNVGVTDVQLTINDAPVTLVNGQAEFQPGQPGFFIARAMATDAAGLTGTDEVTIAVASPGDTEPPVAFLDETDCPDVTDRYSITGQAADSCGVQYKLATRLQGTDDWDVIAEQTGNDFSGELGVFDPSTRPNGVYEILLSVKDPAGNVAVASGCLVADGNLKLGAVILPNTDLSLPAPGLPVALERTYDSRAAGGDFGPGWILPASTIRPMTTRELSEGWAEEVGGGMFTTYYLIEKYRHVVVIRFSDEDVLKFKMDVTPKSSLMVPYSGLNLTAKFVPLEGTQGTLEALNVAGTHLMMLYNQLFQYGTDPYDPVRFKLTRPDGTVYIVHMENGLESMTDVYGHTVTYSQDGITHSSGVSLSFSRDADNRIETVTDSFGRTVTYHYDQNGMLEKAVQSTTVNPYLHRYVYEMGTRLTAITAPDGANLGSFEYDLNGRLTALIDADGNRIIYGHDIASHTQQITDRLGRTTLYEYDGQGNVTYKLDADGRQSYWTYDGRGNKLTETDPAGLTKTYTYDDNDNMLSETDPLGHTTTYTYNARNDVLTTTDALGNVTENVYDANGDLLTTIDALGNITEHTYDTDGNLTSTEDALGNLTQYEYDAAGNRTREIDHLGRETTYTFDPYGNELTETATRTVDGSAVSMTTAREYDYYNKVVKTTDPDGNQTATEYNYQVDKESATIDKNGVRTEFSYDGQGNLTETLFADGSSAVNTYDAEGNRTSSTDRNGRTTEFFYDTADQLIRTEFEDGAYTEMEYDAAGRLTASIDERGNRTEFVYDAAGRRTRVIDAPGNITSFAYDAAGNQTSMTDANGHTTQYVYDALNRRIKTMFPDGTFTETAYDAKNNKTAETDANGRTTRFEYDANGNLTAVVDPAGHRTTYTYDEVGNKLTFTDANGHTERWAYDDLGRVVEHTLPLGMSETFTHDPNGNVLTRTDFNGQTTAYDYSLCCNRLTAAHYPNGSTTTYTYLAAGQRDTVTDAAGTTRYAYDARGRLEQVANPDGAVIVYSYDAAGNRTAVDIPSGAVNYTFDALNRLSTVTDADGGVTSYTYDNVGNRVSVTYPNGVMTTYTYDNLNRLTYLETVNSSAQVIGSYAYTLDATGNRTRVQEYNGRTVDYTYDSLYRLVAEDITDSINGSQSISYTYDAVGNRLSKTVDGVTTSYAYDANNRLLSSSDLSGGSSYTYDNNGNQVGKQSPTEDISYGYDHENRLVSVDDGVSLVLYRYDADGIRTRKIVDGEVTNYLVDKNRDYAQVLEEIDGTGSLLVSYVYGDDLISQERGGTASFYHYDGIGSTRALTDDLGDATDTYNYEAFGTLLNQTGSTENNYLFTGENLDPNSGFYYLRARWLNPEIGRFVSTDPFEGIQNDPVSLHAYLYVANNPVRFTDPSGLMMSFGEVMTAMGLQDKLREMEYVRKVRATRRKFRGYCRYAAENMKGFIKTFDELYKMTKGSKFARHHVVQDAVARLIWKSNYDRGIGMCMPVLGKWGNKFSPHWIMNNVQRNNKAILDPISVASLSLKAAGCRDEDAKEIIKFIDKAMMGFY